MALVRAQPGEIREAIEQLLEEKGVIAGNITHTMLEKMLKNTVKSIVESSTTSQAQSPHENEECAVPRPIHNWGGRWHMLPEDFLLPSADVATAWNLWWCGSPSRGIPPLYRLDARDFTKKQAKIFCEWSFAVHELQEIYSNACGSDMSRPYISATGCKSMSRLVGAAISGRDLVNCTTKDSEINPISAGYLWGYATGSHDDTCGYGEPCHVLFAARYGSTAVMHEERLRNIMVVETSKQ
ncbi:hypothetical protein H257_15068 [Aphanomyces astaci]|uniref:Uncharacterized protein n=1 Tax=Aphanomyces astaci TaxID=112090 RepID=W4FR33_APHAT|nr:hypothetical protein H257_15068 [Aphanomyces astaci]ETV69098.1 hypothetical protein H257_15068 [Aphanomyces astaci]|eukprot:XP_009841351.1 hypothetical protein H257_15068 [Aphanomyces astaci]